MPKKAEGYLIAIEGVDGGGCTTQSKMLVNYLQRKGYKALYFKEPSEGPVGKTIRQFLNRPLVHPALDALLYAADRVDHYYRTIKPAMDRGRIVICDRFVESSLAYQTAEGLSQRWVANINKHTPPPDLCILLDIDPRISLTRKNPLLKERFETGTFLRKVRRNYKERARQGNLIILDAEKPIKQVHQEIRRIVTEALSTQRRKRK